MSFLPGNSMDLTLAGLKCILTASIEGQSGPVREPFLWNTSKVTMRLGTGNYVGLMDDISLFNKALMPDEVKTLYNLKNGASELHRK